MTVNSTNHSLKASIPIPSFEEACAQSLAIYLLRDIETLREASRLSLKEALIFDGRKAVYREFFKEGIFGDSYLEYCKHIKALRQKHLPLRAVDAIRSGIKQRSECPKDLREYIPNKTPSKNRKILKKIEGLFIWQAKKREKASSLASRITCLHGTNSSLLALIDKSDYTMLPTGILLDRGIAVMSGEISGGGMTSFGVNQREISCDSIEGISRCWEYASRLSHSFKAPNEEQFVKQFTEGLQQLKNVSPDDDLWDPLMISFLRLKQWNPALFQKLYAQHLVEIEEINKNCRSLASHEEMRILKALDYPLEKLIQAGSDAELGTQIDKEFEGGAFTPFASRQLYITDKNRSAYLQNLEDICFKGPETLSVFRPEKFQVKELIQIIFKFRINGAQDLANYSLYREKFFSSPSKTLEELEKESHAICPCNYAQKENINWIKYIRAHMQEIEKGLSGISEPLDVEIILQKMIRDKTETRIRENGKPFEKRYQRFLCIFSPSASVLQIDDTRRQILTKPYPLLIASTKIKPIKRIGEYTFTQARLGSDIDVLFVPEKNIRSTRAWLKTHHLEKQVKLYSDFFIKVIRIFPLAHSSTQVIEHAASLTKDQQIDLNRNLNEHVFPLYAAAYPDGSGRYYHGVPHAVRVVLFSICFMELYHAAGKKVKTRPGNLQIGAGLHDCARKDDGVDLWDEESGQKCTEILKKLDQEENEAEFLGRCIAKKDEPTEDIEQRNIHDADCLEILRCLEDPKEFAASKLWAMKDLDTDIVLQLINEAKGFIKLTERPEIKKFLSKTKEPYKALLQILFISRDRFPLMALLNGQGIATLSNPSQYILTESIEDLCGKYTAPGKVV
jgi:hypothetical protein